MGLYRSEDFDAERKVRFSTWLHLANKIKVCNIYAFLNVN